MSQAKAYIATHPTTNINTASVESTRLLKKPNVKIYMKKHADRASQRITELIESTKEDIAFKASVEVLDRTYGKSVQKTETQSTNLNLNIEASQELSTNFTEFLKQQTQQG